MKASKRPSHVLLLAAMLLAPLIAGCAGVVIGGAAVGALVAVDRRTTGAQLEDETIELRASARVREALGERGRVNVTSYNRQVLLTGEVASEADRQQAQSIVAQVQNVRGIVNDLAVMPRTGSAQWSSDALVSTRVRASLVDARDLYAGAFKVTTERGTTYLMGRVSQREADRATQIARTVPGVQKVVRLFEIITEEELQRLLPPPAPPVRDTQTSGS